MLDNARRCEDLFGCSVAVEGMYPARRQDDLLSTWDEYQALLESPAAFAIDLSHVHILVTRTRRLELQLLREMLNCDRCLEVHVSDNDGTSDQHRVCQRQPWWWPLLQEIHPAAVVFTEGNHRSASLQRPH